MKRKRLIHLANTRLWKPESAPATQKHDVGGHRLQGVDQHELSFLKKFPSIVFLEQNGTLLKLPLVKKCFSRMCFQNQNKDLRLYNVFVFFFFKGTRKGFIHCVHDRLALCSQRRADGGIFFASRACFVS